MRVGLDAEFRQVLLKDRARGLLRAGRTPRRRRDERATTTEAEPVLLRVSTVHDGPALRQLAALEGAPAPAERCVLAEVDGSVVAALPVGGGAAIADPFVLTSHLLPLLELWARQHAASGLGRTR
jgi:hypothetical protein